MHAMSPASPCPCSRLCAPGQPSWMCARVGGSEDPQTTQGSVAVGSFVPNTRHHHHASKVCPDVGEANVAAIHAHGKGGCRASCPRHRATGGDTNVSRYTLNALFKPSRDNFDAASVLRSISCTPKRFCNLSTLSHHGVSSFTPRIANDACASPSGVTRNFCHRTIAEITAWSHKWRHPKSLRRNARR